MYNIILRISIYLPQNGERKLVLVRAATGAPLNRICVFSEIVDCVADVVCLTINLQAPRVLQLTGCHLNILCPTLEKFTSISDIRNKF